MKTEKLENAQAFFVSPGSASPKIVAIFLDQNLRKFSEKKKLIFRIVFFSERKPSNN